MSGCYRETLPVCLLGVLLLSVSLPRECAASQQTAGWLERALLLPAGIELQAKLDTGAENSSLHAIQLESVIRNGTQHVRFLVRDAKGEAFELEEPLIRHARIKRHTGPALERPVVKLTICLGRISRRVEVNLTDRSSFDYPLLLGRSFLARKFLIDPDATFRLMPDCRATAGE